MIFVNIPGTAKDWKVACAGDFLSVIIRDVFVTKIHFQLLDMNVQYVSKHNNFISF